MFTTILKILLLFLQTDNAAFDYSMDTDFADVNQFFDVTKDGKVYVRKSLLNADGRTVFHFRVVAYDRSWKPLAGKADCYVTVIYSGSGQRGVGFTLGLYNTTVFENSPLQTNLLTTQVENHDPDTNLACYILSVTPSSTLSKLFFFNSLGFCTYMYITFKI
jgi:hypothetical protein